jgi:hypothetical protein
MNEEMEELFKTLSMNGEQKLFEMLSKDNEKLKEHNKLVKNVSKKIDGSLNILNIMIKVGIVVELIASLTLGWLIYTYILVGNLSWIALFIIENMSIFIFSIFFVNGTMIKTEAKQLSFFIKNLEIIKDEGKLHFKGEEIL